MSGTEASGLGSTETAVASVERLLDRAIRQIRAVGSPGDPALETRMRDPELGTIRVLVTGRTGELIRAEMVVADQRIADALARAVDRSATSQGLSGIDLRIRTEPARPAGDAITAGPNPDGGRLASDQRGWAGASGGFERGLQQGHGEPRGSEPGPRGPAALLPVSSLVAVRRRLPIGSIDIRA